MLGFVWIDVCLVLVLLVGVGDKLYFGECEFCVVVILMLELDCGVNFFIFVLCLMMNLVDLLVIELI